MKKYFLVLAVAALSVSCASVPRSTVRFAPPSVQPVRTNVTKAQEHVTKADTSAKLVKAKIAEVAASKEATDGMRLLLRAADAELDQLTSELLFTQEALRSAQKQVDALESAVMKQTDQLNEANDLRNAAIDARDKAVSKYHKLKLLVVGLAMAAAAFLIYSIFKFAALTPPILYLTLGGPAAVGIFLWFYL